MRFLIRAGLGAGLVAVGYVLGASGILQPGTAGAQESQPSQLSDETSQKIKDAYQALQTAQRALEDDGRYTSAIEGVNSFAVTVGGVDALGDLRSGRGVDPETFAGLYAGRAIDEVAADLGRDEQGRLTYKNKLVRMYSISRLKQLFAERDKLSGTQTSNTNLGR